MHKLLKEVLPTAQGNSEFIISVVADIRGFSEFSLCHESPEVAMYIKRVYSTLIDEYFPFASFFKTTGDGLLMTIGFTEENLPEMAQKTVDACLTCLEGFPNICENDSMINFEVPSKIGFGVARGTACRLASEGKVLDYSGQLLNLASRLTDLARPAGVMVDGQFGVELLSEDVRQQFEQKEVYIRSIAEEQPRSVHIQKGLVELPEHALRPLRFEHWETLEEKRPLQGWRNLLPRYRIELPSRLKRPDGILLTFAVPFYRSGKPVPQVWTYFEYRWHEYVVRGDQPLVVLQLEQLVELARRRKIRLADEINLQISYVPAE